jgi:OPT oligopeptide transporter protein
MFWILAPIVCKCFDFIECWVFSSKQLLDYSNTMYTSYMPILSASVFDNTGNPYNVTRILTKDFVFDQSAYIDYSRVFLPATYVLSYALQFAALPALIIHAICWYRRDLWNQCKESFEVAKVGVSKEYLSRTGSTLISRRNSINSNLSQQSTAPVLDNLLNEEELQSSLEEVQDDVPNLWYLAIGISMTAIGIIVVEW